MLGHNSSHDTGQSTSSRAVIGVAFDGSVALTADLVRDLATEPGTLFYRIIKDPRGRILDITELGRFPSHQLRTAIEIGDRTCRFATCTRPVADSDIDHHIPHPRGPATGANLRGLCRRHQPPTRRARGGTPRIKTHGIAEPTDYEMFTRGPSTIKRRPDMIFEYVPAA